jgi:hypothetical protein
MRGFRWGEISGNDGGRAGSPSTAIDVPARVIAPCRLPPVRLTQSENRDEYRDHRARRSRCSRLLISVFALCSKISSELPPMSHRVRCRGMRGVWNMEGCWPSPPPSPRGRGSHVAACFTWVPAFAGMTSLFAMTQGGVVIPANAGIHAHRSLTRWIPASAGMTAPSLSSRRTPGRASCAPCRLPWKLLASPARDAENAEAVEEPKRLALCTSSPRRRGPTVCSVGNPAQIIKPAAVEARLPWPPPPHGCDNPGSPSGGRHAFRPCAG